MDGANQHFNLLGCISRTFCQSLHFIGHNRKTAARFTGPGGLDRGVQREQVRARRDTGDDLGDLVDVCGLGLELEDARHGLLHALEDRAHLLDRELRDLDTGAGLLIRLRGETERLTRTSGIQIDLGRDLLNGSRGVVEQLLLVLDAPRDGFDCR